MKKNNWPFALAPAWQTLVTVLLCLPGSAFPKENWFDKIWLDKWVHIGLFSSLVFLWCWFFARINENRLSVFLRLSTICFLYGIAMEFVQKYFIPNRSFDLLDIIADGVGCAAGLFFSLRWLQKNRPL